MIYLCTRFYGIYRHDWYYYQKELYLIERGGLFMENHYKVDENNQWTLIENSQRIIVGVKLVNLTVVKYDGYNEVSKIVDKMIFDGLLNN